MSRRNRWPPASGRRVVAASGRRVVAASGGAPRPAGRGSVGFALFPEDATGYDGLMRRADKAMYEAKRTGGGARRAG